MAKIVSQVLLLLVATVVGTVAFVGMTVVVFGANAAGLVPAMALWLVYAALLTVMMTLFSSWFRSRGAAAGAGLAFYFLTLLFSNWQPMARYTFLGLMPAMSNAVKGEALSTGWPLATALIAIVAGAVGAVRVFERQEL